MASSSLASEPSVCNGGREKIMETALPKTANNDGFPGFDGVRWLAAWAVVFSHSYSIATGSKALDPLASLLGDGNSFGNYAVRAFFILSGFLLMRSLDHEKSDPLRFLFNRLLRIVPGFCFAIIVTILVLGPFLSGLNLKELLLSDEAWSSIYWSIAGLGDFSSLPAHASRYPSLAGFVNGSLWSIPYELVCYLFLLSLHMLLRSAKAVGIVATIVSLITLLGPRMGWTTTKMDAGSNLLQLPLIMLDTTLPYFCGGVAFHSIHKRWPYSQKILTIAALALLGSGFFRLQIEFFAFCGPALIVWIGRWAWISRPMRNTGDVSYGIYLFGWPVTLVAALKINVPSPLLVFFASVPFVFLFGFLMRRWVETPVNDWLKPAILRRVPRFAESRAPVSSLSSIQQWIQRLAYWGFFLGLVRFVFYPWPGSANWFGNQIYQLGILACLVALTLRIVQRRRRGNSTAPA